jgi:predicted dehydrogenase/threonine dehydrogenase-like Zn-dependent dehydrogenase
MRQLFLEKGTVAIKEVCEPLLDDHSILVSVHYSFISSGTNIAEIIHAKQSVLFSNVPQKIKQLFETMAMQGADETNAFINGRLPGMAQQLGASCSGQVIAVGKKIQTIRVGDFVACAGAGVGNHADIICVPEHLATRISDEKHLKDASIAAIGAIALQGIRRAELQIGETVCVIGLGLLGQLTVQLAKNAGCRVVGVDAVQENLDLAASLGADRVFQCIEQNVAQDVQYFTDQYGADATIITAACKTDAIMQQAMEMTRKKGTVVLVGDVGLHLERDPFYAKEIDLKISCSYGPGRFDAAYEKGQDYPYAYVRWTENRNLQAVVSLIERGALSIDRIITTQINFHDIAKAQHVLEQHQSLGAVLWYKDSKQVSAQTNPKDFSLEAPQEIRFMPARKNELNVGIIGAGSFAQSMLMPIVRSIRNLNITAVVDVNIANSIGVSHQYGVARTLVNDTELCSYNDLDAVLIASPHKYHADQALRALNQGKAVFLEKPMVTDFEQLEQFRTFLKHHPSIPFCVDYNRSFAPFITKIKRAIAQRSSPLVIHYRMNAGFIPKEHWIQTESGAGRLIGEACHIFDLFCFLTEAKPRSVSVEALQSSHDNLFPTDNFSVQISFNDGSICSLLYTSLGDSGLGMERMELFFDSKAIVMDDYMALRGYGLPKAFNDYVQDPDRGHRALVSGFFNGLLREHYKPLISHERLLSVAELTLIIDKLACEGGGEKSI